MSEAFSLVKKFVSLMLRTVRLLMANICLAYLGKYTKTLTQNKEA